jgi:hypothetical protein
MTQRIEFVTSHPTKWGPEYVGLRTIGLTVELRKGEWSGRWSVHVPGTPARVGWVTRTGSDWSAAYPNRAERIARGVLVARCERTRRDAVAELVRALAHVPGPVQDAVEGLWPSAEAA